MDFFIRIKDGQPFEHPIYGDNFRQAFPDLDVNNLPSEFVKFEPCSDVNLGLYEILEIPKYVLEDGVCKCVIQKRSMTAEEKFEKQQTVIALFNQRDQAENWSAWILDEATCRMVPPILRPERDQAKFEAGIFTYWCGADNNWRDTPAKPVDENQYKFDFFVWQWVQIVNS